MRRETGGRGTPREQPGSASSVRGTRCGECQSRLACNFSISRFPQCFLLDDFALRTILKTALNIAMHRSCDVFERSKRAFFCFARDFFALGANLQRKRAGSPLCVGIQTAKAHAETRREEDIFRMILGNHPFSSSLQPLVSGLFNSQYDCSNRCRKLHAKNAMSAFNASI